VAAFELIMTLLSDRAKEVSKPMLKPVYRVVEALIDTNRETAVSLLAELCCVSTSICNKAQPKFGEFLTQVVAQGIHKPSRLELSAFSTLVSFSSKASLKLLLDTQIVDISVFIVHAPMPHDWKE